MREPDFEREILMLSRIATSKLSPDLRVPRLLGIVAGGDNREATMGILVTMITGMDLRSPALHSPPQQDRIVRGVGRAAYYNRTGATCS
jgi:hypothetical protein